MKPKVQKLCAMIKWQAKNYCITGKLHENVVENPHDYFSKSCDNG